jgi:hypothetical protein
MMPPRRLREWEEPPPSPWERAMNTWLEVAMLVLMAVSIAIVVIGAAWLFANHGL